MCHAVLLYYYAETEKIINESVALRQMKYVDYDTLNFALDDSDSDGTDNIPVSLSQC